MSIILVGLTIEVIFQGEFPLIQQLVLLIELVEVQEARGVTRNHFETEHEQVFGHGIDSKMRA